MILELIAGETTVSWQRWTACHQARAKELEKINYRDCKNIACHSHALEEGKNTGEFGHKEYIAVKHHFKKFYVGYQWDVKLKSWKVCSPPTHTMEEWVLLAEEYPWCW